jgi:hypothetical protein
LQIVEKPVVEKTTTKGGDTENSKTEKCTGQCAGYLKTIVSVTKEEPV